MTSTTFIPRSQDLISACQAVVGREDDPGWALLEMRQILDRPSDSPAYAMVLCINGLVFDVELDPDSDHPDDFAPVARAVE